ncbi:hypothetical protein Ami103574_10835 [Aminipila butyrica]|uniref:Uncharacterized protein n=1 Tax=Aminipila butyrica TaxID=433296 RepID=A0A858BYK2_9FIRM|nr:hypothetical protein [Aminipila butyrica]QIB69784.1 hypothetical protein Ami103574_10835 [Aminipila butyrica]
MEEFKKVEKHFQIPHNFKKNGRIFNLIEKEALTKSLVWVIPITILIFKFTPLRIDNKFFLEVLLAVPPVIAFCQGLDIIAIDILWFRKNKKVYYNLGKEKDNGDTRHFKSAYEREKRQQAATSK